MGNNEGVALGWILAPRWGELCIVKNSVAPRSEGKVSIWILHPVGVNCVYRRVKNSVAPRPEGQRREGFFTIRLEFYKKWRFEKRARFRHFVTDYTSVRKESGSWLANHARRGRSGNLDNLEKRRGLRQTSKALGEHAIGCFPMRRFSQRCVFMAMSLGR